MYNMPLHFKFIDTQRYTRDREHVVELVQGILCARDCVTLHIYSYSKIRKVALLED